MHDAAGQLAQHQLDGKGVGHGCDNPAGWRLSRTARLQEPSGTLVGVDRVGPVLGVRLIGRRCGK